MNYDPAPASHTDVQHEHSDVNVRGVLAFAAGLVVVAAVVYLLVWLLFAVLADRAADRAAPAFPLAEGQENRLPPEPRLQTNPRQDLRDLHSAEDEILNNYGWVDRNAGTVRIPIGEAMKLTIERGLPVRAPSNQRQQADAPR